ncbi:MetQ/NlpA family ABC transporter substrate-binding protein [Myxococcus xanthus]|uniref:MetQ/NlpA family ABC transporter substrate-binding protein n=1 Tax=Myxococcus xanthus TaxID=34 RepID=UPI00112A412A|nr:MetQ/NlpA family ABC transporter substrate-binding protein [Myxococcus xanthus]QDE80938.1 methionine ABC transporter substrate-binding protein [Myxococcus xanthus]QDE95273.1 methionine ABC transporter substrate-binding protein [Myxococcus xanthus]QDF02548.1 methionine ABC transporter substrate-binding protein [Myxococcus xanthus]
MKSPSRSLLTPLLLSVTLLLTACQKQEASSGESSSVRTLKVGVNPVPHGDILRAAAAVALREGVRVDVVEFTDYVQPNIALSDKQLDANYFQHEPYLERFAGDRKLALTSAGPVHLEPLALYSTKFRQLAELPEGAQVTLPADPSNLARALRLLEAQGLLRLREGAGATATVRDVVGNPRKLDLREIDAEQQPRTLEDVAAAVINGNYFLEAQKHLKLDAKVLAREAARENPYANVLAVRQGDEQRAEVRTLVKALQSDEVRRYIESTYGGAVVPAF